MANRYWVGGTNTWNATVGTKWSATDGGGGGASVPTSTDDVFFTAASGSVTVTIGAASTAKSINFTGFTGTIDGSSNLTVSGNVTFVAGMTQNWTGTLAINAASTLVSAGKNVTTMTLNGNFTFTLSDDWNVLGLLNWTAAGGGTQTVNGNNMYCYRFVAANGTSRIIVGTTNIIVNAPSSGDVLVTSALNNNITINAAGTITVIGLTLYGGTFTTTTSNVVGTALTVNGTVTLNIGNVYFSTITFNTSAVVTLSSNINCISQFNVIVSATASMTVGAYNVLFENSSNVLVGSAYFQGTGTYTLSKDLTVVNIQFGTAGNAPVINGSTIYAAGDLTILGSTSIISGTTNIVMNGTGTVTSTQSSTGNFRLNLTFNTSGVITISGNINYRSGTITYTAGTMITTGSTLNLRANATLNTAGMSWYDVTNVFAAMTITINSTLTIDNGLLLGSFDLILAGTAGFVCHTMSMTTALAAARSLTLVSGISYLVNNQITITGATNAIRYTILSSTGGSQAILTLHPTATQNVVYVNATDIDSSDGQTIYSFQGVLSNTLNWDDLNASRIGTVSTFVFWN